MYSEQNAQLKGGEKGVQWKMLNIIKAEDYKFVCLSMGLDYKKMNGIYPRTFWGAVGLNTKLQKHAKVGEASIKKAW